jgi:hypothetical protein
VERYQHKKIQKGIRFMKYLTAVLVMGLLSACTVGASSPSEQPLESMGQSESASMQESPLASPSESASEQASAAPDESAGPSGTTSAACDGAWQSVDVSSVETIGDLVDIGEQLRPTFQDCSSVSDWVNAASEAFPMLDAADLETWASGQCTLDDAIGQSPVCQGFAA